MGSLTQAEIESLYSQRQKHTVLHESIRHELDGFLLNWSLRVWFAIEDYLDQDYFESKNARIALLQSLVNDRGIEYLLVKILAAVIHTTQQQTYQQVIGYLQAFLPHEDPFDRAVTAGELLALGSHPRGLYTIIPQEREMSIIHVNYWNLIEQHLTDQLEWINTTTFNPPLVEKPLPASPDNCGYHTIKEPIILGDLTQHDEPQNLEAIDSLNEIEWVLDPHVLAENETHDKPFQNAQAHENFVQMTQDSRFIYNMLKDRPFYFVWQYDCRGRIYSHGYHVNLQASQYKKALLNFNHYEEVTHEES